MRPQGFLLLPVWPPRLSPAAAAAGHLPTVTQAATASQGRAFADGRLGASRRWCESGAGPAGGLRRSGAGLRRGAALRARRRAAGPREVPGAAHGDLAEHRPSGCLLRALTLRMPGPGRWRRTGAGLALCRSLAASLVSTAGEHSRPIDGLGTRAYRRLFTTFGLTRWRCAEHRLARSGSSGSPERGRVPRTGSADRSGRVGQAWTSAASS